VPGAQRRLGRGLDAILPELQPREVDAIEHIPCGEIDSNPAQPRRVFDAQALEELADSIRVHGVIQPIIVRRVGARYQVVAGERRLRAAVKAGLEQVPAVVREFSDAEMAEIALVENLQRQDLNPLEQAEALQRLIDEFGLTQEEVSQHLGWSRPAVANALRLLQAGKRVRDAVWRGELSAGHARALLPLGDGPLQEDGVERIRRRGWSVRETERWVRRVLEDRGPSRVRKRHEAEWGAVEERLRGALGTRVRVRGSVRRGVVEIEFFGLEDLDRLLDLLAGRAAEGTASDVSRETVLEP
jgi:ParB family chromosome partitioning protein